MDDHINDIGGLGVYGHVKLINALSANSYAAGEALSAYQGYLLGRDVNELASYTPKGYHFSNGNAGSANPNYLALNIKFTGASYGNMTFIVNLGGIYIINVPLAIAGGGVKSCTYKLLVDGAGITTRTPSLIQTIRDDDGQQRLKIVFNDTSNESCSAFCLEPGAKITDIYATNY